MAELHIEKLEDETLNRLRSRAAERGVSVEEEARQILERALAEPDKLGTFAFQLFGPQNGVNLELGKREHTEVLDLSK